MACCCRFVPLLPAVCGCVGSFVYTPLLLFLVSFFLFFLRKTDRKGKRAEGEIGHRRRSLSKRREIDAFGI